MQVCNDCAVRVRRSLHAVVEYSGELSWKEGDRDETEGNAEYLSAGRKVRTCFVLSP